jgi:hypothetical protein
VLCRNCAPKLACYGLREILEEESFDDWLAPIAAKNWIADAQITPDCLATKEQCSVYLSVISLLSPEGDICLPVV